MITASSQQRQPEEDLKAESAAQQFGHVGGDAGEHDAPAEKRPSNGRGKRCADVVGKAVAGDDPQPGRHALEEDQHERPQGDHPQQRVVELAAAGHVGGPVARVDEADGDDEPGPQVAQEVAAEEEAKNGQPVALPPCSGGRRHRSVGRSSVTAPPPPLSATVPAGQRSAIRPRGPRRAGRRGRRRQGRHGRR